MNSTTRRGLTALYIAGLVSAMLWATEQVLPGWTIVTYSRQLQQLGIPKFPTMDKAYPDTSR